MRTFRVGSGPERKQVVLEVRGTWLRVTKEKADGTTKLDIKEFASGDEARSAADGAARQLLAHGYQERGTPAAAEAPQGLDLGLLEDAADGEPVEAPLPRMAGEAAPQPKPAKKKKKKKKKPQKPADALDKRVIVGIAAAGLFLLAVVGYLGYAAFLQPPSIVGHWEGSRTEHEVGRFLTNTQYRLILDDRRNASMAMGEGDATSGTYAFAGGRLKLTLKDEEGEVSELEFKAKLGGATLDLFDPQSGRKVVQLIRFTKAPAVKVPPPAAAPEDLAKIGNDERLASVAYAAKDGAFRLRHPEGWTADTGARADNTYSWVKLAKGSARIRIYADVAGSLLAGPNAHDHEEGSELAPVHGAHERYKKDAAELYGSYEESRPATFKGAGLGEGRIATFTATDGGMFGSKVRGVRVTLLTNDRRVSVLCDAPVKQYEALLPTFLATCKSLSR